jgi:hypothetical protein
MANPTNVPWHRQFASVYLAIAADRPIELAEIIQKLRPILSAQWTATVEPAYVVTPIQVRMVPTGETMEVDEEDIPTFDAIAATWPYEGVDVAEQGNRFVTAFKWNIRRRDGRKTDTEQTRALSPRIAAEWSGGPGRPQRIATNVVPYGMSFFRDYGIPSLPTLPRGAQPDSATTPTTSFAPWAIAGIIGAALLSQGL